MKRRALEQHLREHGCQLVRHGAKHDVWVNPANGHDTTVPRHREIKSGVVRSICKRLEIPLPPGL